MTTRQPYRAVGRTLRAVVLAAMLAGCRRPCPSIARTAPSTTPVSSVRVGWLQRGINMSLESGVLDRDLALVRGLGLRHVRLAVDPVLLFDRSRPCRMSRPGLDALDAAIDRILGHGLAVIVDLHPSSAQAGSFLATPRDVDALASSWQSLAGHLSGRDPNRVFLEILNEPRLSDRARWSEAVAQVLSAIRSQAPANTVILSGAGYSSVDDLVSLSAVPDRNVVYNFHFYEPHAFTHQGAAWDPGPFGSLRGIPYPFSRQGLDEALRSNEGAVAQALIRTYGEQRWDGERIAARIATAAQWGAQTGGLVMCNEFGAYRPNASERSRMAWISDVRLALEAQSMGWTFWNLDDSGFGLLIKDRAGSIVDRQVVSALGASLPEIIE
jgi:endoglucanase